VRSINRYITIFSDRPALVILGVGLLVRLAASWIIPPGFDEAYYGVYAHHPAWGYFDRPPLVAFTTGFGLWISGVYTFVTLRLGALLLFLLSSVVLYESALLLYNRSAARTALLLLHTIPYFFIGMGAFVIPDNALGFFWLLFLYGVIRLQQSGNERWFLLSGAALGLALLSKYHAVFLAAGLGLLLVFHADWRRYWRSPWLYAGAALAFLIFLPNILWNAEHDWISYVYQFSKGGSGLHLSLDKFFQGIGVQAGYLLPWYFVLLVMAAYRPLRQKAKALYFLQPFVWLPILAFTLIGATRTILPHWPMPGYLGAVILLAGWMQEWNGKKADVYIRFSAVFMLLLLAFVLMQVRLGVVDMERKKDPTLNGFGWKELAGHLRESGYLSEPGLFLFTHKWFLSGELDFALEGEREVTVLNRWHPQGFAYWSHMDSLPGRDALFITSEFFPENAAKSYEPYFEEIIPLQPFSVRRNGKAGKTFYLWYCKNMKAKFPWPYGNR